MMPSLEKAPRWFILLLASIACIIAAGACGFIIKNVYAQIDRNTTNAITAQSIAISAQNRADIADKASKDLKEIVTEIKNTNETFRKEYREDKNKLDDKLDEQKTLLLKISNKL
jgi:uncharacterized membrane protein YraQ (UPF0718 family)